MNEENNNNNNQKNTSMMNPMQSLGGNILVMTDPSSELYRIELTMRNLVVNNEGELCRVGGTEWAPLLNENGIIRITGLLHSIVARNSILSHIEPEEINRELLANSNVIIKELMQSKRYNIVNDTARSTILKQCQNIIKMTLLRAMKGGERSFLKGSQQEVTYRTEQKNANRGLWDRVTNTGG